MDDRILAQVRLRLEKIARWHDQFPATGQYHPDGAPMSYGWCYGANDERDFMRNLATEALVLLTCGSLARPAANGALPDGLVVQFDAQLASGGFSDSERRRVVALLVSSSAGALSPQSTGPADQS